MIALIRDNLDANAELCVEHGVPRLELFGSAACGDFDPERSDLDFLVEFHEVRFGELADRSFGLMADLEVLFGRRMDLVRDDTIKNPYRLKSIMQTRVPLYAAA